MCIINNKKSSYLPWIPSKHDLLFSNGKLGEVSGNWARDQIFIFAL